MTAFEVVLTESTGVTVLTPWVTDLSFRSIDPGGFASVTFDLSRKLDVRDFERNAEVCVFDGETGEIVGCGRLVNPGRGVSRSGEVWSMAALGEGPAQLQEREVPYLLIDTRLENGTWRNGASSGRRLQWAQGNQPNDDTVPGWTFTIAPGALNSGYTGRLENYSMEQFALVGGEHRIEIGGYKFSFDAGNGTDANRIQSRISSFNGTSGTELSDDGFAVSPQNRHREITTNWPAGGIGPFEDEAVVRVVLRYERDSPSVTVGGDDDWIHAFDLRVSALRLDRNREPITDGAAYATNHVLAHEAIIDSWARFCPEIDLAGARIDETATYQHRDLVWPDGITPYGVLQKLMQYDPAFTWAVWERQANGLFRAEWRAYDTNVRYELSVDDGFDQTSDVAAGLDAAYVISEAPNGEYRVLGFNVEPTPDPIRTSKTVTFDGKLDDTDFNEAASALGTDIIDTSGLQATAARVTVARKVYDHFTGRWVKPFMVFPGYLCRVNGIPPQSDTMNVGQVEGAAIFKIVSNDYSAPSASSRLELNAYTVDERRALANLMAAQR